MIQVKAGKTRRVSSEVKLKRLSFRRLLLLLDLISHAAEAEAEAVRSVLRDIQQEGGRESDAERKGRDREQQDNRLDDSRFCLRHHNVGYQRPYGGTSSLRKLEKQFDDIGAKYADVGSDDDEVIEVDDSSDDGRGSDGDKNEDEDKSSSRFINP
mmetsp:Transcript_13840/g.30097  ORF Transcript_13840/g.30097 Transcript_13840/m.30097 type:complete len:155 (-) Transcript_13840:432-896(-)